ncbi:hypothetical protein ACWF94_23025 [Streptomyces sp. NPDC055078]
MLAETLVALAGVGGTALVGAMATDAWASARAGAVRLFRGDGAGGDGGEDAGDGPARTAGQIEGQLDGDARTVADAAARPDGAADADALRQALAVVWTRRLVLLLEERPAAEPELRELVDRLRSELPGGRTSWQMTNIARDNSTQFAAQGGNVVWHQGSGTRTPAPDDEPNPS